MKKVRFFLIFAYIFLMVSIFVYYFDYLNKVRISLNINNENLFTNNNGNKYQFSVIVPNINDPFWQSIRKGAFKAAKEYHVAVEFNGPQNESELTSDFINTSIASKVDGIATYISNEKEMTFSIDKAFNKKIPVITLERDAKNSKRASYIGTNNTILGKEKGNLILNSSKGSANVAILMKKNFNNTEDTMQNLEINSMKEILKNFPKITLHNIQLSTPGIFGIDIDIKDIFNKYPDIDTIICNNTNETLKVTQLIIDLNKVGEVKIIGFGDSPEIINYVEKGVIYSSIISDPELIGYESIKTLINIKENKRVNSYIDINLKIISKENVYYFKNNRTK